MLSHGWLTWARCSCLDGPTVDVMPELIQTQRKLGDTVEVWSVSSQSWERGRIVAFRDAINFVEVQIYDQIQVSVKCEKLRDPGHLKDGTVAVLNM